MRKSDELTQPNSTLNRSADDEPLFILRAHDPLAPSMVRTWALMYWKHKQAATKGDIPPRARAKYEEAMELANRMDDWLRAHDEAKSEHVSGERFYTKHPVARELPEHSLDVKHVIERLCRLQGRVYEEIPGMVSADCFCGEGGFWNTEGYDGTFAGGYRNDGVVLKFIEDAVSEKLQRRKNIEATELEPIVVAGVAGVRP